jgi:Domain of unknown function (DUF4124)
MKRYFTIITLALISFNVHAGLSKWVDAEGKVHYSDTPPPDVTTQSVRNIAGKDQADAPASYSQKSVAEQEAELKKAKQQKTEAEQKKAQQDANTQARKNNCAAARENVQTLKGSTGIVTYNAKGERTYMDENTRAQRLEESNKAVSTYCD